MIFSNTIKVMCCVLVLVSARKSKSKEKTLNSNIDSFITQLMKSKKFDTLANKIADIAAEKIVAHHRLDLDVLEAGTNGAEFRSNSSGSIASAMKIINPPDVIKADSSFLKINSDEIQLKYKKFTKRFKAEVAKKSSFEGKSLKEEVEDNVSAPILSNEHKEEDNSAETSEDESNISKHKKLSSKKSKLVKVNEMDAEASKATVKKATTTKATVKLTNTDNEDESEELPGLNNSTTGVNNTNITAKGDNDETSAEDSEEKAKPKSEVKSALADNTPFYRAKENDKENEIPQPKKIFHHEGDKNYTFISSEDYNEYYEKLQKEKNLVTVDKN